jgi:hypothetical protein
MNIVRLLMLALALALLPLAHTSLAQDEPPAAGDDAESQPGEPPLVARQRQVADRYRELERLLLRMAELTAPTDPRRAALLRQAVAQSKDRAIEQQFDELIALLRNQRLSAVVKGQGEVHDDLVRILELLLSEDRSKHIESEKQRVREYLKRVNKIIREQKSVQGATQRDDDPRELADRQGELSEETGKLADDVRQDEQARAPKAASQDEPSDEGESKPGEPKDGDQNPGDSSDRPADGEGENQPSGDKKSDEESPSDKQDEGDADKKPSDDKDQDGDDKKPSDDEKQDAESGDSKQGKPSDSEKSEGKPREGQPQDGPPPVGPPEPSESSGQSNLQQNPAQQRLEKAQQRMQEAQKKLEEAQKSDALEKQEEALRELEQAKAELEEILRQLREEEMARTLAMLEARFRKMLDAQIQVYEGTQRLDKVAEADRDRDDLIEAGRLSRKQGEIAVEADKALAVLQEEGSAVAFPEAVIEIRDDMITVRDRLAEAKTGELTQSIEQDIIAALEEMITALEKAQQDAQDKMQQGQPSESGDQGEMPLVDALSELKMIRALQMRVNTRTARYSELVQAEQAEQPEILEGLRKLAERQERIHKATRDIVAGRNR